MLKLQKPPRLKAGDRVAIVSPSSGMAGDAPFLWRYRQGCERLRTVFGLEPVEMPYTLAGSDAVYRHPEKRAEDLMRAFSDPTIRAIIPVIGGNDSVRMLPYIDFNVIRDNPKVVTGYSDSTVLHFMCMKAGLASFYGLNVMCDLAENVHMSDYTVEYAKKALFSDAPVGEVRVSGEWTDEYLPWEEKNRNRQRVFRPNTGYELLQGTRSARGALIGGCMEVMSTLIATPLFPPAEAFDGAILFLETSEVEPPVWLMEDMLRHLGTMGLLSRLNGLVFGKPIYARFYEEYKPVIRRVLAEFGRGDLPVLYNASFGHNEPKCLLPYGAEAEICCAPPGLAVRETATRA